MSISSKKIFTETSRVMFDLISGYHNLAKLTHKINHYMGEIDFLVAPHP